MSNSSGVQDYDVSHKSRMWKKFEEAPYVPIGIAGMLGAVIYGGWNYRKRGAMSTSVYLMHLRVKAQGMVVGAMALGVGYSLISDYLKKGRAKEHGVDELH